MENTKLEPLPEPGKYYHFWDDGKHSPSRHYICRCERVVPYKDARKVEFDIKRYTDPKDPNKFTVVRENLKDIWKLESRHCTWLFAADTDCFVELSCPKYDENTLWAARTKDGGWFTMDVQTSWQGGDVDVTGRIFESVVDMYESWGDYDISQELRETEY